MHSSFLVIQALTLIGPATLMSGYSPETKGGLMVVLLMSLLAAVTLGVLLGRWLYQPPGGAAGEGEE